MDKTTLPDPDLLDANTGPGKHLRVHHKGCEPPIGALATAVCGAIHRVGGLTHPTTTADLAVACEECVRRLTHPEGLTCCSRH